MNQIKTAPPDAWVALFVNVLQNDESAAVGCNFQLACGNGDCFEGGNPVVLDQNQFLAVKQHDAGAHLAVSSQGIDLDFLG